VQQTKQKIGIVQEYFRFPLQTYMAHHRKSLELPYANLNVLLNCHKLATEAERIKTQVVGINLDFASVGIEMLHSVMHLALPLAYGVKAVLF
jgi:hypothetical protein